MQAKQVEEQRLGVGDRGPPSTDEEKVPYPGDDNHINCKRETHKGSDVYLKSFAVSFIITAIVGVTLVVLIHVHGT